MKCDVVMLVPADGWSQSQRAHSVSCGPRAARRIMREMLADPDRYLQGHSRRVSIFDVETGERVAWESVPDTKHAPPAR